MSPPARAPASEPEGDPPRVLVALATRARAGDAAALEDLATALYPNVRTWLGRRLRGAAIDPDDVTQIAMAHLVLHLHQCRAAHDRALLAWARAVAWRTALEILRTGETYVAQRAVPLFDDDGAPVGELGFVDGWADLARVIDEPLTPRERLARAAVHALDRMPEALALLFWMRLVDDASWPEVAAALETTVFAVKRRYERAVVLLRALLRGGDAP